uniref:G-protein coupled receptors family 1 profile domain-containing protein n=1 Tax=Scophthalmus maximus TaxID=52904 RepID=A0A8D3CF38_SCOMX
VTGNISKSELHLRHHNYLVLILGLPLILVIILGNVLVCVSVLTHHSLKTATNYFIVSLAVADLLLAVMVLPLYVYSEFLGVWTLTTNICDALMTMDVMLCTASILNLCAISVDRYIAVVVPLQYNRNQFSVRQLALITATWVLSLGVASPVIFGLNQVPVRDPSVCKLENDRFVVYSSVCSFFVPCPVMLLLYYLMFRGLRRWSGRSRSQVGRPGPALSLRLSSPLERDETTKTRKDEVVYTMPTDLSPSHGGTVVAKSDPRTDSVKSSRVSGRERKAMKVLPVVVGVFLACWTPFFIVHVTKVLCQSCDISPALISVVTWLGYVNSAVNPVIYTAFNTEFRNVFHKLIWCGT